MAELIQIVATTPDGECPVAISPFLPVKEAAAQLAEFRENGYGARQQDRPLLEARDQAGRTVELEGGEKKKTTPKD